MTDPVLILAPIRGVTDVIFRNAFAEIFPGFDRAVAPFISTVRARRYKPSQLSDVLPENNDGPALTPQIMSNDPDDFSALARHLFDLGYHTVNWNLGCPFRRVAGKMRGSGLLPHPDRVADFLERTVDVMPNRLSIKIRLGRYDAEEIERLIPVFNAYPLAEVIVHPRTGVQMYAGTPDLEAYGRCLAACRHPVVYNGDIVDIPTFQDQARRFPETAGWMIGRGAVADPFLPGIIKTGRHPQGAAVASIRRFHDRLLTGYCRFFSGPSHPVDRMKGIWLYLSRSFAAGRKLLKEVQKAKSVDRYSQVVDRFFDDRPEWIA
jgi:tRNA-dihydrouridine synthase B